MHHDISFAVAFKDLINCFPNATYDSRFKNEMSIGSSNAQDSVRHAVVYMTPVQGHLHWQFMSWGCMPFDMSSSDTMSKKWSFMLHTPGERIFMDGESYWNRIRDQRCLVPVSGTYFHSEVRGRQPKITYFVHIPDQPIFFLPGLYSADVAIDMAKGEKVVRRVFTIVTRPANRFIKHLLQSNDDHKNSMPLFLPFSLSCHWIAHNLSEVDYQAILNFEMPSEALQAWPVYSTHTGEQRLDYKEKIELLDWTNLPPFKTGEP